MNDIKNVCVYSASSTKIDQSYFDAAEKLGKILAERKINLINGYRGDSAFHGGAGLASQGAYATD